MAAESELITTNELNIYLGNDGNTATRVLKISDPNDNLTLEYIRNALAPAFARDSALADAGSIYFFYDDGNQGGYDEPMTHVESAEIVQITKVVTPVS